MTIDTTRPNTLYVSVTTHKGLGYVARGMEICPDDLAEQILDNWLRGHHPDVMLHMEKRWDDDKKFRKTLNAKLKPNVQPRCDEKL